MATRWTMTSIASPAPFVGVGPAGDLVEVVADARDLPGALPFDFGRRGGPRPHARHGLPQQGRQRHAGGCGFGARQSASSAGDTRAEAAPVRRSATVYILNACRTLIYIDHSSVAVTRVITLSA